VTTYLLQISIRRIAILTCLSASICGAVTRAADDEVDGVTIERGVAYLPEGRAEKADLYLPKDHAADVHSPAVFIIHGGGWLGGKCASDSPECVKHDQAMLANGTRYRMRIEVRRGSLLTWLEDKQLKSWQGDLSRFAAGVTALPSFHTFCK
jgi:hypothetical protein